MLLNNAAVAQEKTGPALTWQRVASLPSGAGAEQPLGIAGPVAGVHNGVLLVGGGANFPDGMPWMGGKKKYHQSIYAYKLDAAGGIAFFKTLTLPEATAYGASVSTPQGIVYAGGEGESGISKKVLLLQWDAAYEDIVVSHLPHLPLPLSNASIAAGGDKVYVAGGETTDSTSHFFMSLNLKDTASGWQLLLQLPQPTSHAVMVFQEQGEGKTLYLIGGRRKNRNGISGLYDDVFRFDVSQNSWQQKASLPYTLSAGTGATLNDGSILLFGGDKGKIFHQTEKLIAAIAAEKDAVKKEALNQQKIGIQSSHPGFSKEVLQYNASKDRWIKTGVIPFDAPVTTTAIKWNNRILIPSGEVKAGVRSPHILMAETGE